MPRPSLLDRLRTEAHRFGFFQAVAWLEWGDTDCRLDPVGRDGSPHKEVVRFSSDPSLAHPAGSIRELRRDRLTGRDTLVVSHPPGLIGFMGALPQHYKSWAQQRDNANQNTAALRAWLDLFNHRLIALFYRAWEKYRFVVPFLRYFKRRRKAAGGTGTGTMTTSRAREARREDPDPFTQLLLCLIGLGEAPLRDRIKVVSGMARPKPGEAIDEDNGFMRLSNVEDLSLLYFGGLLADRARHLAGLEQILSDYFRVPVRVVPFTGQWLTIPRERQTRLDSTAEHRLGYDTVCGERVWDVRSKFTVRLGPLTAAQFTHLLPDPDPIAIDRKGFYLLCQLVRWYVGPEFDFDVRLVLRGDEVPTAEIPHWDQPAPRGHLGPRLGWNTWLPFTSEPDEVADAVFEADGSVVLCNAG